MNILCVDDERLALDALAESVGDSVPEGKVYAFRTGEQALTLAGQIAIDVAFLDIEMREMNGLALAKRLKEIRGKTNIIFVTGYEEYALDAFGVNASGYLIKPISPKAVKLAMTNLRFPILPPRPGRLRVQCFGNFEVFDPAGKPAAFTRQKSKELFAYLVDRRGAQVTMAEIAAVLWEDGEYDTSRNRQIHCFLHDLIKSLDMLGIKEIVLKQRNAVAIDITKLDCDAYACMCGDPAAINAYRGEYMAQYPWAEFTAGTLAKLLQ